MAGKLRIPDLPADAYSVARENGIEVAEAVRRMREEGWEFFQYDWITGEEEYIPPPKSSVLELGLDISKVIIYYISN